MKKNLAVAMAVTALMLASAVSAFAQHPWSMKVTVPFDFTVENQRIPAGDYTVEKIVNGHLRMYTSDGKFSTSFLVIPKQGKTTAEVGRISFHRYGTEYFLASISMAGQNTGWEVLQGKLESELAKKKTGAVETATLIGH